MQQFTHLKIEFPQLEGVATDYLTMISDIRGGLTDLTTVVTAGSGGDVSLEELLSEGVGGNGERQRSRWGQDLARLLYTLGHHVPAQGRAAHP
ncbi:hypothetical protein [Pseudonocardia sp. GCM10023141]|uniref:hypothetical protein n=1 Tax=Pseudonocardia sp. GCM10023141 TaxID=3252653 RepID=UPI00360E510C